MGKLTKAQNAEVLKFAQAKQFEFIDLSIQVETLNDAVKFEAWTKDKDDNYHCNDAFIYKEFYTGKPVDKIAEFKAKISAICIETRKLIANNANITRV